MSQKLAEIQWFSGSSRMKEGCTFRKRNVLSGKGGPEVL